MEPAKQLFLLGVSYRAAPLVVREALSFDSTATLALLRELGQPPPRLEAAVLSTCNRTEFYLAAEPATRPSDSLFAALRRLRPQAPILRPECERYELEGPAAARHLFRVACGLDSAVLGDVQILSQVKDCRRLAADARSLGRILSRAFDQAVAVGKRARAETAISHGNASVGSAVAGMLAQRLRRGDAQIVILGAGEVASSIARHLSKQRLGHLCFINRTAEKAARLAQLYGGVAREWGALPDALSTADVVVAATSAPAPILTRAMLDEASRQRDDSLLVIDAGVPRNVEAGSSVSLLDIDGIRERHQETLRVRQSAVPAVERLIEAELDAWQWWQMSLPLESVIKLLYQELADHQQAAARQLLHLEGLTAEEVTRIVVRPMRHLLHRHAIRLRQWATNPMPMP